MFLFIDFVIIRSVVWWLRRSISGRIVAQFHRTHIFFDLEGLSPLAPDTVKRGCWVQIEQETQTSTSNNQRYLDDRRYSIE